MSLNQILVDIAPEMAVLDADLINRLIAYSSAQVDFGYHTTRKLAIAYLTAHTYTLSQRGGASGNVSSIKEGDLAKSFGGTISDSLLGQTSYGLEFLRLRRMYVLAARTRQVTRG